MPLIPGVIYSGSANGESLWALPAGLGSNSSQSPEASSDATSASGQPVVVAVAGTDDVMADIDWVSRISEKRHCADYARMLLMLYSRRIIRTTLLSLALDLIDQSFRTDVVRRRGLWVVFPSPEENDRRSTALLAFMKRRSQEVI